MKYFPKPHIVVSKCLGFEACRYDGLIIEDDFVKSLEPHVRFEPVCPEVAIGLGIPREPVRVVRLRNRTILYQPAADRDITEEMGKFIERFLSQHREVDGFIVKSRSPSCGIGDVKVYHGTEADADFSRGSGFFGEALVKQYPRHPIEDESRLKDSSIREHFLTKLFTLTSFRKLPKKINNLITFHTRNKLLLMAYNQSLMKEMGYILAHQKTASVDEVFHQYNDILYEALSNPPQRGACINILHHAFSGFSDILTKEEKQYFLNLLDEYRDERIPLRVPVHVLEKWAIKYKNACILEQTFIRPYPKEVMQQGFPHEEREYRY
jgi:uncharacterized protein YbgA (DUF1722 family)/uncharacterized protein YbbK (DUF523 family)